MKNIFPVLIIFLADIFEDIAEIEIIFPEVMPGLIYKRFKVNYLMKVKVTLIQNIEHNLELVYPIDIP